MSVLTTLPPVAPLMPAEMNLIVPEGVRFDGRVDDPIRGSWLQFTDLADGPSHGATFIVPTWDATSVALARRLAECRARFRPAPATVRSAWDEVFAAMAEDEVMHGSPQGFADYVRDQAGLSGCDELPEWCRVRQPEEVQP